MLSEVSPSFKIADGLRAAALGIVINISLATIKIITGVVGSSYALIADGIESLTDVFSSIITLSALKVAGTPPDRQHPYGHGKAESLAGLVIALALIGAALFIAIQSIREILNPHVAPKWYVLIVLAAVIVAKETLFRFVNKIGVSLESGALKGDAWHHRSDALTSVAVFVGVLIALIGGKGYESADDWAAMLACIIIAYNGVRLFQPAFNEVMDATIPGEQLEIIRAAAAAVPHVVRIEKCRTRKSGLGLLTDIHVHVDGAMSVTEGHRISHEVKDTLMALPGLRVVDVIVHIEPA
ncbi:MAG: cation diffusion facilitator family transporter [Verrucomicrobiota bacterium]|nr:cation diffusion facilitator family transporter [Verrucomicrobiota bacterium]